MLIPPVLTLPLVALAYGADTAPFANALYAEPTLDVPALSAQRFRPSVDGTTPWTDTAEVGPTGDFWAATVLSYAYRPLVFVSPAGLVTPVVGNVAQLDALAAVALGPVRLGVDVPVYLRTFGGIEPDSSDIGDVGVDAKLGLLSPARGAGLALYARAGLPTSSAPGLSQAGVSAEGGLVLDGMAGPLRLLANLGGRYASPVAIDNLVVGSAVVGRLAAVLPVGASSLALDANADLGVTGLADVAAAVPAEVMLSGNFPLSPSWDLVAGGGTALSPGIGAPLVRVVLGVAVRSTPVVDTDGDGLVDRHDACVTSPEDIDGFADDDGCPEPTRVTFSFVEAGTGKPVANVNSAIGGRQGAGTRELDLPADSHVVSAVAPGFEETRVLVEVPPGGPVDRVVELRREVATGRIVVRVRDATGRPVEATIRVPGTTLDRPAAVLDRVVPAGAITVSASAPGYVTVTRSVTLPPSGAVEVEIVLVP